MLDWRKGTLRIGVSQQGIGVLHTTGWRSRTSILLDQRFDIEAAASPLELLSRCQVAIGSIKLSGMPATVVLSDDFARLFMVAPPQNVISLQDCKAAAAMRFQSLYGESMASWQLAADWNASRPFLACCLPHPLLSALQQFARESRFQLISVQPQFVASLNGWRHRLHKDDWFGQLHNRVLSLGATVNRKLHAIRATNIPDDAQGNDWLQQHVAREALRLNLPVPRRLQLCGEIDKLALSPTEAKGTDALICSALRDPFLLKVQTLPSPHIALARSGVKL
ncbi:hypothetical protein [Undibacterium terreum]|uniref:Uncharacterized protein n=1 Tax=Undibacterium terreum TaxID=1224302 RepID=A0A916XLB1_9BURK|nr:hypothetical protein [Undibacterium terreum]GGC83340.1 hypothetical protein GCM10011396_33440 [Undibacterium terreum]